MQHLRDFMNPAKTMDSHGLLLQLLLKGVIFAAIAVRPVTSQAMPGCPENCGNLSIPYPFGTREGCYLDEPFFINCHNNSQPSLRQTYQKVIDISLEGQLRILAPVAYDCYDEQGDRTEGVGYEILLSRFSISNTRNKFTAVGCDTKAMIAISQSRFTTGCLSMCSSTNDLIDGSCNGIGCCQTSIPRGIRDFGISVESFYNHSEIWNFNNCSYAFLVEEDHYNFTSIDLENLRNVWEFPVIIDWSVGNSTCEEAQKNTSSYKCLAQNSVCRDFDSGPGYLCSCSDGYQGNPYISNGCQDIDECQDSTLNDCTHKCINAAGNYTCLCPEGYQGDGREGKGCTLDRHQTSNNKFFLGSTVVLIFILVISFFAYWRIKKRKSMKLRESFFKQNGGMMLQQLLSDCKSEGSGQTTKIFTEDELNKATDNFRETNVIGQGGYGTVYKGTLATGIVVAIKKSRVVDRTQIEQFANEVIVLSQIKHPNVVKLLGCCLETPVPLLVYEFITNNTLYHHIHDEGRVASMPWELRLRIATETAAALAHMHSAPMHIIHRDVKSANVLLDDEYIAKVSDFGVSRLVPLDQTQLATLVMGTFGYIDPEYFHSGLLTKKSDVYSFGVVLVELLTGEVVVSVNRPEQERNLATYFISSLEDDRLDQVLEKRVKREGHAEQTKGVAELAKKCLRLEGNKRPSMKEVKEELEALMGSSREMDSWDKHEPNLKQGYPLLESFKFYDSSELNSFDSPNSQVMLLIDDGRY